MLSFTLQIESKAKPAGAIMNGHITQNKSGYSNWKSKINTMLRFQMKRYKTIDFPLTSGEVHGVIIEHHVKSFRCGDLLNIAGAALDTLTKSGIIKDDCPSIVNRFVCRMVRVSDKTKPDRIEVTVSTSRDEWEELLEIFKTR